MAALRKKSDKSGISYGILKKVFDRGIDYLQRLVRLCLSKSRRLDIIF